MAAIERRPLVENMPFGARLSGVNLETLEDQSVRAKLLEAFEDCGLLVFEELEPSSELQFEMATLFGPVRDHSPEQPRTEGGAAANFLELTSCPGEADIVEVDGKQLSGWTPFHFDACYSREIYRAGLLRALEIPPSGGMTGFADGVQLYSAIRPDLRETFEELNIIYDAGLMFIKQRFGMPDTYRSVTVQPGTLEMLSKSEGMPRTVHPAIWKRQTGEKVLHVSPWQAAGIEGREHSEGDALLEALCQEIHRVMTPYWHAWKPTDMVIWDNWRFLHGVSGHDPQYTRRLHRATIEGDYGLGRLAAKIG